MGLNSKTAGRAVRCRGARLGAGAGGGHGLGHTKTNTCVVECAATLRMGPAGAHQLCGPLVCDAAECGERRKNGGRETIAIKESVPTPWVSSVSESEQIHGQIV